MVVERLRKEEAEAEKFLYLASGTDKVLSDQTVIGFRAKNDSAITDLVENFVNGA